MRKVAFIILLALFVSIPAFAAIKPVAGRAVVTTSGTEVPLSATTVPFYDCTVCAETDNTGVVVVGGNPVIAAVLTRTGIPLNPGDCRTYSAGDPSVSGMDLMDIYIDAMVNGDGVTFEYRTQK